MKGLYIHLPFCRNKCSYCGFYSETDKMELQPAYFKALTKDLRSRKNRDYQTLYIGGGTPSCVDRKHLAAFLDIESIYQTGLLKESTIEANPESIDEDFLRMVHLYKFTRISIGCQSTSEAVLKKLTRIHSADDIFRTYDMVRKFCPDISINLDMIYDIPGVEFDHTHQTIKNFIKLDPDHISAYTYSHDTEFLKDNDDDTTDFMLVREFLEDAGYAKYEISNFAKKGHESLHNINYWQLGDYDGLGSSAWSLENTPDRRYLRGKSDNITKYIENPTEYAETEITESPKTALEEIVFGLRITKGIDFGKICRNIDAEIRDRLYNSLIELADKELIVWNGSIASLTRSGELLLDSVQELLWRQLP